MKTSHQPARSLAIAALVALFLSGCETMPGVAGQIGIAGPNAAVSVAFSDRDRQLISEYYAAPARRAPPGLAKRDRLPPGLEKQLQRNGRLPPGLQGRGLPGDLEGRLTRLPEGYARIVIGGDIVISNTRTQVVVDILKGAVPY
jgi:predicted small secreted protein